jgi:cyclic pyranopterin phosphate synthase
MGDTNAQPSVVLEAIESAQEHRITSQGQRCNQKGRQRESGGSDGSRNLDHGASQYDLSNTWMLVRRTIGISITLFRVKSMRSMLEEDFGTLRPNPPLHASDVAKVYSTEQGWKVGFIESITNPFCGNCSRARLSANGSIYTCLFASQGHDLRGILRMDASSEDVAKAIQTIWLNRTDRYSEERTNQTKHVKVEMSYIGG